MLENIRCLKREAALARVRSLVHETPEIGLDSVVHIVQDLSPAQRAEVAKAIGRLEGSPAPAGNAASATPASAAPGPSSNSSLDLSSGSAVPDL